MHVVVIHRPERKDREQNICELIRFFGDVSVIRAVEPYWIEDTFAKAVRGCALSHLSSIERFEGKVLVLEDDAQITEAYQGYNQVLQAAPDDILILGWDKRDSVFDSTKYFCKFSPPFYGTQAVLYNATELKKKGFLLHAYRTLAWNGTGIVTQDKPNVCYESVICTAAARAQCSMRMSVDMLFSQTESKSDRI